MVGREASTGLMAPVVFFEVFFVERHLLFGREGVGGRRWVGGGRVRGGDRGRRPRNRR